MSLSLNERIAMTRQVNDLSSKLLDKKTNLSIRLKLLRNRSEIISSLLGSHDKFTVQSVNSKGSSIIESIGYEFDAGSKEKIAAEIKNNEAIVALLEKIPLKKGETKNSRLNRLANLNMANDIYFSLPECRDTYDVFILCKGIHDRAYKEVGEKAQKVVNHLIDNSPISNVEAKKMAANMPISKALSNRFKRYKKSPYRNKQGEKLLRNDMSNFIKITAYDGKPINFEAEYDADKRAYYINNENLINLSSNAKVSTVWHEMAHSIEYDHPETLKMTKDFLHDRLKQANGKIDSLGNIYRHKRNDKTGKKNYSRTEMAIDDGAYTPYVTKVYDYHLNFNIDGAYATEVISMGLQALSNPENLGLMIVNDPDHFKFIVGLIDYLHQKKRGKS